MSAHGWCFRLVSLWFLSVTMASAYAESFVNFETPHVSPIALSADKDKLLAVNTAANRLEVFSLADRTPVNIGAVPVGLDPVSVRVAPDQYAWVVNHISDSISIVDLETMNAVRTLATEDEPTDVVFAGSPERAFVTCSQVNKVLVYDLSDLDAPPIELDIEGEDPRMLAVSPDGSKVYAAIFESGNQTTIVGSHQDGTPGNEPDSPYGGENPAPNDGDLFDPPINPELTTEPPVMGIIVRKNSTGQWLDDNVGDWSNFVSGTDAFRSGRVTGWDVVDNDIAEIDAETLAISYHTGMMNMVMALDVRADGRVTAVGTDATNEVRFEPVLKGRFLRVNMAVSAGSNRTPNIADLNPHLDYSDEQVAQQADPATYDAGLVEQSIGDPRAIVWNSAGARGFITGMGSNNLITIDRLGRRVKDPVTVGEGPTGLVLDESRNRLYVLNKFDGSISVVNTNSNSEIFRLPFFDPTPTAIKVGRKHLYDTHKTSGLGHTSCASCHVDSRIDRLAWDLGNPAGDMTVFDFTERNCGLGVEGEDDCHDYHPMKGPMLTQTMQDIIGHEPHHWRGDKLGLEEFNSAFTGLQGAPAELTESEMQELEDFLSTIHFPPNPYRNMDNTLPESVPLDGQYAFGRFVNNGGLAKGEPMPEGNAVIGLDIYRTLPVHRAGPGGTPQRDNTCVVCHTLPTGLGASVAFVGDNATYPQPGSGILVDIPPGPKGEAQTMITGLLFGDIGQVNTFKVPQLRNLYDRLGYENTQVASRSGFGFFHDGSNTLVDFISRFKGVVDDQMTADIIAFLLAFSGSDLPMGSMDNLEEPPGPLSQDAHASAGLQLTFDGFNNEEGVLVDTLAAMQSLADQGALGLVAKGIRNGEARGFVYTGLGEFQPDRVADAPVDIDTLRSASVVGEEMTFTLVPAGSETRIGVDQDVDGTYDGDE